MTRRGPKARLVQFDGIGHAPALMADDQIDRADLSACSVKTKAGKPAVPPWLAGLGFPAG
jgi:hypothetical protein